jgi:hypothetical protein
MNRPTNKSELLSRYVAEVKRIIGPRAPKDVDRELESLLAESIEARETESGRELSLQEVSDVLRAFGAPGEVADRYSPRPRHLIGPELYPVFMTVVAAILGAAAIVPLILMLVSHLAAGEALPAIPAAIFRWVGLSYQIAFGGLGWAVLVFAMLERFGVSSKVTVSKGEAAEAWNPLDLPAADDRDRESRASAGLRIYIVVVMLVVFNFFPQWLGLYIFHSGSEMKVLSMQDLGIVLPMWQLSLWWMATLVQNVMLFRAGRWTAATRWIQFALGLAGAAILYPLIGSVGEALRREPFTSAFTRPEVAAFLARLAPVALTVTVLFVLGSSAIRLWRLLRSGGGAGFPGAARSTL